MYWPAFQFSYSLDIRRLMPHLAAVEAYKHAAQTAVLPPQWRTQAASEPAADSPPQGKAAFGWIRERFSPGSAAFTPEDILAMHRLVAEETKIDSRMTGAWRVDPVQVGRREVGGLHMGAPAEQLPRLMEEYVQFINSAQSRRLPPIIHALLSHFFFVTLHPFGDGNGRTSRLVATAILCQRGYNVHGGFYALSDYFYQNDGIHYHRLLHRCWQQGSPFDLTPFVAFGIEGLVMELRSIDSFIRMKLNRIAHQEISMHPGRRRGRFFRKNKR